MIRPVLIAFALMLGPASAQTTEDARVAECFANTPIGETAPRCLGQAAKECGRTAEGGDPTQQQSLRCIQGETAAWDRILNDKYQASRATFLAPEADGNSAEIAALLQQAQRAWIAFRDAECALRYTRWQDGSIRDIVFANCMMVATAERSLQLRDMFEGP